MILVKGAPGQYGTWALQNVMCNKKVLLLFATEWMGIQTLLGIFMGKTQRVLDKYLRSLNHRPHITALLVKLFSGEYHRTPLMVSQYSQLLYYRSLFNMIIHQSVMALIPPGKYYGGAVANMMIFQIIIWIQCRWIHGTDPHAFIKSIWSYSSKVLQNYLKTICPQQSMSEQA